MPGRDAAEVSRRLQELRARADELNWLHGRLADDASRRLLVDKLVFYVLGHEHARIGPSTARVDQLVRQANDTLIVERDVTPLRYAGSAASHLFDLRPLGMPITLESYLLGVQGTFQLEQYRSPTAPAAHPRSGDIAIDGGGCFGETALWLAHVTAPGGRVITLEFAPENLRILRANLRRNPALADQITLEEAALWRRTGEALSIDLGGPASTVMGGAADDGVTARSITVDEIVATHGLPRIDFIKMDIEGAEPAGIDGATLTLTRHRPRLAIAVYHALDHLYEIPRRLEALDLGYRFALGHFTMHDEETVLYAWTDQTTPSSG